MERFAFYGTLRVGEPGLAGLGLQDEVEYLGPCRVAGRLFLVDGYPGLVPGDGEVVAELCAVPAAAVPVLDRFEGFEPGDPGTSLFVRVETGLLNQPGTAWAYLWCGDPESATPIPSGDWARFRAER